MTGSMGKIMGRRKARIAEMERIHPGVRFSEASLHRDRAELIRRAKQEGYLTAGEPKAVYNYKAEANANNDEIKQVKLAYREAVKVMGGYRYASYNELHARTGLSYERIFAVCQTIRQADPFDIRFTVDAAGRNVFVKMEARL
jgi:hypothetical protein